MRKRKAGKAVGSPLRPPHTKLRLGVNERRRFPNVRCFSVENVDGAGEGLAGEVGVRPVLPHPDPARNIEHPTSNAQHPIMAQTRVLGCSMLGVGCWMFRSPRVGVRGKRALVRRRIGV